MPAVTFDVARSTPRTAEVVGVPVATDGPVPRALGLPRAALAALGFDGKPGQTLVVPGQPVQVAVGVGPAAEVTPAVLRTAAAALARAAQKHSRLATSLADVPGTGRAIDPADAAQAVAEGLLLASYRFTRFKTNGDAAGPGLATVTLTGPAASAAALARGAERGRITADAVCFARDLANTPPTDLNARDLAALAVDVASEVGLGVEVLDEQQLAEQGFGGLLGVNRGSVEPPRFVKLTYRPRRPRGTLALVGKGVMYDSGGISLKPSDGMHQVMKMDMTGAAVVLATLRALPALAPPAAVVGYLPLTDNMPSGSALKLGDVLRMKSAKTVEVHNTDAEGRLILADALAVAVADGADAIVDIATLTGACMSALGLKVAGVMGNDQGWVDEVRAASARADEPTWQLPLHADYRKLLDSDVADLKNVGGPYGGAITAGLFLREFVGDTPWAHLDIAGPMRSETDDGWLTKGATAFGVRTFLELVERWGGAGAGPGPARRKRQSPRA